MKYLANILTLFSLACAFASLVFSLEEHYTFAAWAIIISVITDGLDGQIAKRSKTTSDFGKELDSLVDAIAFGIAPSILGYIFIYRDFYISAVIVLFLYLVCGVMRLAKYNITPKGKMVNYFYGLPTTISGGVLASFILIYRRKQGIAFSHTIQFMFIIVALILAFLMVSRTRYLNIDGIKQAFGRKLKPVIAITIILLTLSAFLRKIGIATFTLFSIYLVFSPLIIKKLDSE